MKNAEIAAVFAEMADIMEILGEDVFRVNSYRKAARTLEDLPAAIEDVAAAGKLEEAPGIGKATAAKIQQYLADGRIAAHEELRAKVPAGLMGLLAIGGLGPKTVAKLWRHGGIESVAQFKEALAGDRSRLEDIPGLGAKKLQHVAESLTFLEQAAGRVRLDQAGELAAAMIAVVEAVPGVGRIASAGSLRRGRETIGDVDLLCEAQGPAAHRVAEAFCGHAAVQRVLARGATKCSIQAAGGVEVDLRMVPAESFGAALQYFTGSKEHNVRLRELAVKKGLKLNEYGLFRGDEQIAGADEEGIYAALGLQFVPPELREDRGEVEAAAEGKLPRPLEPGDIRGDMHMHTTASDGANSIEEMIDACRARGYAFMAICDHSKAQAQAHGLDERRLARHAAAIRKAAAKYDDILVLAGVEVDIFKDGRLDFEADVLAELDFVTASPHSALTMGGPEATRRIIAAIEHPHVHCIGHPTGREIGIRPGMELDIASIASAAAANDVALEVNAHPIRLDLRDVHIRAAIAAGAKLLINTDAHSTGDLALMHYGVTTARRGWATAADVVNCWSVGQVKRWLAKS
jgi:DNA polymerase (family 10)